MENKNEYGIIDILIGRVAIYNNSTLEQLNTLLSKLLDKKITINKNQEIYTFYTINDYNFIGHNSVSIPVISVTYLIDKLELNGSNQKIESDFFPIY